MSPILPVARSIYRNTASSWLSTLLTAAAGLGLVPFLLSQLGSEGYGLVALLAGIVGLAGLIEYSIRHALSRQLAAQIADEKREKAGETLGAAAWICALCALGLAVACFALPGAIASAFKVSDGLREQAVTIIRCFAGPSILLAFAATPFTAILSADNRFDVINYTASLTGLGRAAGIVVALLHSEHDLEWWAGISVAASCLQLGLYGIAARKVLRAQGLRFARSRTQGLGELTVLAWQMLALQLSRLMSVRLDPFILASFLGPAMVALYQPGATLSMQLQALIAPLSTQLSPLATQLHTQGKSRDLIAVLIRGTRLTLLLAVPALSFLFIFGENIAQVWLGGAIGEDYLVIGRVISLIALIDFCGYATGGTQWPVLVGMNRVGGLVRIDLVSSVCNVVASIGLVAFTSLGVLGVLLPTLVTSLLRRPVVVVYTARVCSIDPLHFARKAYARPFCVLLVTGGAAWLLKVTIAPATIASLLTCAVVVGLVWAGLAYAFGLDGEERSWLRRERGGLASAVG